MKDTEAVELLAVYAPAGREESQRLLLDFLDEPAESPRRAQAMGGPIAAFDHLIAAFDHLIAAFDHEPIARVADEPMPALTGQ